MPVKQELDVIIDGLNLGRGMSFKNISGHLPFGGCKATVTMDPLDMDNMEIMGVWPLLWTAISVQHSVRYVFWQRCHRKITDYWARLF